jgi:hypothetical protein
MQGTCIGYSVALLAIGALDLDPGCDGCESFLATIQRDEGCIRVVAHGVKAWLAIFKPANLVLPFRMFLFFPVNNSNERLEAPICISVKNGLGNVKLNVKSLVSYRKLK